ncbi:thyroid transcription factor 1-associated protein 26 homolog [Xenentodon cancila]
MAPTERKTRTKNFLVKDGALNKAKASTTGVKKKRKWIHDVFEGSVKEGQGFAFKRKQKVKHEYNKLLRSERKKKKRPESGVEYEEEFPEHLRHLYAAEAEKLREEAWRHRVNRSRLREEAGGHRANRTEEQLQDAGVGGASEATDAASGSPEPAAAAGRESLPMSNRMRKKMQKKTSYQKTKEEFEKIREKRRKKKEEYQKNKQQREEAIQRYKQKKLETFQILSKKTKKGQPNLNLQMEYLLQKIQGADK